VGVELGIGIGAWGMGVGGFVKNWFRREQPFSRCQEVGFGMIGCRGEGFGSSKERFINPIDENTNVYKGFIFKRLLMQTPTKKHKRQQKNSQGNVLGKDLGS